MKKLFASQTILLLGGTVFAWYNVILNFMRFYHVEGTIFKIQNCSERFFNCGNRSTRFPPFRARPTLAGYSA